jgi:hypothetical protein
MVGNELLPNKSDEYYNRDRTNECKYSGWYLIGILILAFAYLIFSIINAVIISAKYFVK